MKKYLVTLISLLVIPVSACTAVKDLIPKALANQTSAAVQAVKVSSSDVFQEIQTNIDLVTNLKVKMDNAKIAGTPLSVDDYIKDIQTVSDSYSKLSGQHDAIRKNMLQKITDVENLQSRVNDEIATLQKRRADYVQQLNTMQEPNPDIAASRRAALTQAIKYVDNQVTIWQNFNSVEANIISQMSNVETTLNSFLSMIDSTAIVYKEALALLTLQKNINDALALFTQDVPKMQQLTADMQKSWANLDALVSALVSISAPTLPK